MAEDENQESEHPNDPEFSQKLDDAEAKGLDAEGHKLSEIDQPHVGVQTERNEDAQPLGDVTGQDLSAINEQPGLEGGVTPETGKPIPNTEGRTADRDQLKEQDVDTTNATQDFSDIASAQPQTPDPKVLSGRSYDVMPQEADRQPKDLMQAAGEAVTDPGLDASKVDPANPQARAAAPHRPVTAPPSAMEPTLPPGAKPQPGAPEFPPLERDDTALSPSGYGGGIDGLGTDCADADGIPEGYTDDGTGGVRFREDHRGIKTPRTVEGRPRGGSTPARRPLPGVESEAPDAEAPIGAKVGQTGTVPLDNPVSPGDTEDFGGKQTDPQSPSAFGDTTTQEDNGKGDTLQGEPNLGRDPADDGSEYEGSEYDAESRTGEEECGMRGTGTHTD